MAQLIQLPVHKDQRGSLSVMQGILPFAVQRIFFIYDVHENRGGHRHRETQLAMVATAGQVSVYCQNPQSEKTYTLKNPSTVLLLASEDWHDMTFEKGSVLTVFASTLFDPKDYIYEKYR